MKRLFLLSFSVLLFACGQPTSLSTSTSELPPPEIYRNDTASNRGFVPNPDFAREFSSFGIQRSALSQEGEIIVVEGDDQTVASGGPGLFGILEDNQVAIVQQVLAQYPDNFDTIQIYTSFTDEANAGSAYYQSIANSVSGIGINTFNGRAGWGLPAEGGRLSGFSNMNSQLMWGGGTFEGLNQITGGYHAVIAQELSHRWLFFMLYDRGDGNGPKDDLIGRQGAHWSRLADSEGSVQDGQDWEKIGPHTFHNNGGDNNFAPLDLYGMGFVGKDAVPDFFFISNATLDGNPLDKTTPVPTGVEVMGDENVVKMADIIRAMGPRNPPVATENPYYRAAFVLVTAPGEPRSSWEPHLNHLQEVARDFPESWRIWTRGSSAICTKTTAGCDEPSIGLADYEVADGNDGLIGPGESFSLTLSIINSGIGTAENVLVELEPVGTAVTIGGSPITAPPVGEGQVVKLGSAFSITVSSTVACGDSIAFRARFTTEEGPIFRGELTLGVGTKTLTIDPLDEAPDWSIDPDGNDTALRGKWDLGDPDFASVLGVVTQPGEDHSAGESELSFHTGSNLGSGFSANDLDGGFTTLESPAFALRETRDPKLVFWYWRRATDFSVDPKVDLGDEAALVVQATNDGGDDWVELGRITAETEDWTRAEIRVRDAVEPTNRVKFRFVATDETMSGTVEIGVDDIEVIDYLDECQVDLPNPMDAGVGPGPGPGPSKPRDEGGCTAAGSASPLALLLLALLLFRRRR